MGTSLDSALTGMLQQQRNIEMIAGNLANVNTTGYKRASVRFQDVLDTQAILAAINAAPGEAPPVNEIVTTVQSEVIERVYSQGSLTQSRQPLDLAVSGRGFFRLKTEDGDTVYTRDGGFRMDAQRRLVSHTGAIVDPPITFPQEFQSLRIWSDGTVTVRRAFTADELAALAVGAPRDGVETTLGQVGLTRFDNLVALMSIGNNYYAASAGSDPTDGFPGEPLFGLVRGGFLEASNVDIAEEMVGLVISQRIYQLNASAYKTIRDMLDSANELLA